MTLFLDHFGGQVLRGSANGESFAIMLNVVLGETKVGELNIAFRVDENIFRFQTEYNARYSR